MRSPRVCLIVDNPLRDLDGLVVVGLQLARMGMEVWLTPMYEQALDVRAISADIVLLNYIRSNNLAHALAYRQEGIRVGVLDTEGVGGKTPAEFASLVSVSGGAGAMDFYCVWGPAQQHALTDARIVPDDRLALTGCPRYDYCAHPWRNALQKPRDEPGYVLVNTNFPIVNPRFSRGSADEVDAAVKAGYSREVAEAYVRDARIAQAGILELVESMLIRWPGQRFVLRPHPFESNDYYRVLERHGNYALRQEGTSVEWLNQARALVHLNCSTAVEAALLGKPAISPAWLDAPVMRALGPSSVSYMAESKEALYAALESVFEDSRNEGFKVTNQPLEDLYHEIDGHAAERVARTIAVALDKVPNPYAGPKQRLKSRLVQRLRSICGHHFYDKVAGMFRAPLESERRSAKRIRLEYVQLLVNRLQDCAPAEPKVLVQAMQDTNLVRQRMASMHSVKMFVTDV
jgi:surface carbohydrate biosynthesis protein